MSKASKKRACLAVGREISPADCGENRVSRQACPADCVHLPFAPANYSQLLEIEEKLDHQCMDFLLGSSPDRAAMERALQQARHDPSPHALHAFYEWNLFFQYGADGRTCAERLEQSATAGFKNDDRVLLRAKRQTRVALLEIHRVLDGERLEAVDLLAPDSPPLRLHDRNLASMATRFASGLVWLYPLPHYWRLSGTAILIPGLAQFDPREIVLEIAGHLGGPLTEPELRRWLEENFVRFDEALQATARMRRMQMFAGMDAKFGKAVYELQSPFAGCRDVLDALPDVEPDNLSPAERQEGFAEARVWFAEKPEIKQSVPPGGRPALGRVLLGQAHWRLEAMGAERLARLRRQFDAQLGNRVRFTGERLDDFGASLAAKEPAPDKSLIPPRLLENPQKILLTSSRVLAPPPNTPPDQAEAELFRAADRAFLDDQIPALDNRTPREAARDPALRPRLIRLLKQRVQMHDERNLKTGRADDINWLLRELGADEICFDPPPWRPATEPPTLPDIEPEAEPFLGDPNLPPASPLPAAPLSLEEAARRLDAGMAVFETAAAALDALAASGFTIIDDADELTADCLSNDEFSFAISFILQAVLALVPPGHRAPPTSFDGLQRAFTSNVKLLLDSLKAQSPDALITFLNRCLQPNLMQLLAVQILEVSLSGPKKFRPSLESQPVILALIKSVIDELDQALRP
jgi:hypothetical protein